MASDVEIGFMIAGAIFIPLCLLMAFYVLYVIFGRRLKRKRLRPVLSHYPRAGVTDTGKLPKDPGVYFDSNGVRFDYYRVILHPVSGDVILAGVGLSLLSILVSMALIMVSWIVAAAAFPLLNIAIWTGIFLYIRQGPFYYACLDCGHLFGNFDTTGGSAPTAVSFFLLFAPTMLGWLVDLADPAEVCPFCQKPEYISVGVNTRLTNRFLDTYTDADSEKVEYRR